MQFHEKRRQQFLSETYFLLDIEHALNVSIPGLLEVLKASDSDAEDRSSFARSIAEDKYKIFFLKYTAGEPIAILRDDFIKVVDAYECAAKYYREYANNPNSPIFGFQEIDDFECIIQLVSLAILLHRRELIPRIHSLISNSSYDGQDAMYEELICHDIPDRPYLDVWYHQLPYLHLLDATDLEDPQKKIEQLRQYLKIWYTSMKKAPWHDSHLDMRDDGGAYFGYWAMEAGAICYLYNIDDSSFRDHIVYPKDLVDYAKFLDRHPPAAPSVPQDSGLPLRVEGGEACPRTGYWHTPAKEDSRRHFKQNDIMPVFEGASYGATIWQWSENQNE